MIPRTCLALLLLVLAACPDSGQPTDGAGPDGGPDAGPDLVADTRPPKEVRPHVDQYVFDPDLPIFDVGCMTRMVSVTSQGKQFNNTSALPAISRNGKVVVFMSDATNLGPVQTVQVFSHDLVSSKTQIVSKNVSGAPANQQAWATRWAVSQDGRFVAYASDATNLSAMKVTKRAVFRYDRVTRKTIVVSVDPKGNPVGRSYYPSISDDGRYVAFRSESDQVVPGDTNKEADIFVRDVKLGTTVRASVADDGSQAAERSSDAFQLSGDGRWLVFCNRHWLGPEPKPASKYKKPLIWLRDLVKKKTTLVSRDEGGKVTEACSPSISHDGKRIVFNALDKNVYLADMGAGKVTRISSTTGGKPVPLATPCHHPAISGNGRWAVFTSASADIVAGDTNMAQDIFRVDLNSKKTVRVSVGVNGQQGVGGSTWPFDRATVADSGRVAFETYFDNLLGFTDRGDSDVFVRPGCM